MIRIARKNRPAIALSVALALAVGPTLLRTAATAQADDPASFASVGRL